MARDIRTRLIGDDDMTPAFKSAAESARRLGHDVEGAALKVEKATRAAAAAEQRFGKESLQAREAAHRLAVAELELAAATDRAKESTEEASRSVGKSNGALKDVAVSADRSNGALKGTAMAMGRLGAPAASVVSLVGPLSTGMLKAAHSAVTLGRSLVAVAPAAAALPALAAGALLVQRTLTSIGPAMRKAVEPVSGAFAKAQHEVDALATRGLRPLAKEFVRVNFPAIHGAMKEIAHQTNGVVVAVGKWVNSTAGQSAIGAILKGTLGVTKQLAAVLPGVVTSFGNMVGRAAGPGFAAIGGLGPMLGRLADGAKRLFDSVGAGDVAGAFDRIGGAISGIAGKLSGFGHAILDVGNWMADNQGKVKAFSDVLAGVGIALGIWAGGGPIAVAIGAFSLLVNHWDAVKTAAGKVAEAFGNVSGSGSVLSGIVSDLSSWWSDRLMPALKTAGSDLMPTLRNAVDSVTGTLKDNKDTIAKVQGVFAALGVVLTEVLIPAFTLMYQTAIPLMTTQFKIAVGVVGDIATAARIMANTFLDSLGYILHGMRDTFGFLPGIGPKLKEASAKFDAFRAQVNKALGGIHDHEVNVTINTRYKNFGTPAGTVIPAWYGKRAAGGPVTARTPYWVGERGPEMFVPASSGTIVPTPRASMARVSAGGGGGTTMTIIINATGSDIELENKLVRVLRHAKSTGHLDGIIRTA